MSGWPAVATRTGDGAIKLANGLDLQSDRARGRHGNGSPEADLFGGAEPRGSMLIADATRDHKLEHEGCGQDDVSVEGVAVPSHGYAARLTRKGCHDFHAGSEQDDLNRRYILLISRRSRAETRQWASRVHARPGSAVAGPCRERAGNAAVPASVRMGSMPRAFIAPTASKVTAIPVSCQADQSKVKQRIFGWRLWNSATERAEAGHWRAHRRRIARSRIGR